MGLGCPNKTGTGMNPVPVLFLERCAREEV